MKVSELLEMCKDGNDPTAINWRDKVVDKLNEGDISGMRRASLPAVQYNIIRLAMEGLDERTQLAAAQFIMGQEGHGPIQRVDHHVTYEKMSDDQLISILQSKLMQMKKLNPGFSVDSLSPNSSVVEAEFEEVK